MEKEFGIKTRQFGNTFFIKFQQISIDVIFLFDEMWWYFNRHNANSQHITSFPYF